MKIKDWMTTKVVSVGPEASVKEAFKLMKKNGFRHLPVMRGDKLVGFVTDRDLRRPAIADVFKEWNDLYRLSDELHVEDVMITQVQTVKPDDDLLNCADKIVEKHIGAFPVVEDGKVVGIVTVYDFLRALVQERKKG